MKNCQYQETMYELVTIDDNLNCIPSHAECKEIIKEKELCIPKVKPDIEEIAKILIKPELISYKIISTPEGPKLVIEGKITEKIFYVADKPEQSVHCANFSFPFCTFIKLNQQNKIEDIKFKVEDIIIQLCGKRKINQCILLFICAIPQKCCCDW